MNETIVCAKTIILNNNRILLVQRSNDLNVSAGEWEIVGGRLEFGEGPIECLVREVKEETGLYINVIQLLYAMSAMLTENKQVIGLTYLSKSVDDLPIILSSEHQDYKWVDKNELAVVLNNDLLSDFYKHNVFELLP